MKISAVYPICQIISRNLVLFSIICFSVAIPQVSYAREESPSKGLSNIRLRAKNSLSARNTAIVLSYIHYRWNQKSPGGWPAIPASFFLRGNKPSVGFALRPLIVEGKPSSDVEDELGAGAKVYESEPRYDGAYAYRDKKGIRLLLRYSPAFHGGFGEVLLSKVSHHQAKLVRQDLYGLRTNSGIGIGDTKAKVLRHLGKPSDHARFRGYDIALYLQKPEKVPDSPQSKARQGTANAFVFHKDKIVEIWMADWTTERSL